MLEEKYEVLDYGIFDEKPITDYGVAERVGISVSTNETDAGILICGTGLGMSISANKIPGIRAALCNDLFTAKKSREHNDANLLVLGSRVVGIELAKEIVKIWLETEYEGGRHISRNKSIMDLDRKYRKQK
ncbi:MAG: ribose 5-phosphate isomerase B [Actinobacteria bacterium]|nr:ribose 5-phosphate isomerase B [Actinomycetota bacterium]